MNLPFTNNGNRCDSSCRGVGNPFALALIAALLAAGCIANGQEKVRSGKGSADKEKAMAAAGDESGTSAAAGVQQTLRRMEANEEGYLAVSRADGRMLAALVEAVDAQTVVEIGTSTGYSGLWIMDGLVLTGGRLTTYELDPERAATAGRNFAAAGVKDRITIHVGDAHELVTQFKGSIDVLFLDADKEGYLDYLRKLLPQVREGGLVIAHNMRYPTPDPAFIAAITTDPDLHTIFVNMEGAGLGVTQKRTGK